MMHEDTEQHRHAETRRLSLWPRFFSWGFCGPVVPVVLAGGCHGFRNAARVCSNVSCARSCCAPASPQPKGISRLSPTLHEMSSPSSSVRSEKELAYHEPPSLTKKSGLGSRPLRVRTTSRSLRWTRRHASVEIGTLMPCRPGRQPTPARTSMLEQTQTQKPIRRGPADRRQWLCEVPRFIGVRCDVGPLNCMNVVTTNHRAVGRCGVCS